MRFSNAPWEAGNRLDCMNCKGDTSEAAGNSLILENTRDLELGPVDYSYVWNRCMGDKKWSPKDASEAVGNSLFLENTGDLELGPVDYSYVWNRRMGFLGVLLNIKLSFRGNLLCRCPSRYRSAVPASIRLLLLLRLRLETDSVPV